MPQGKHFTVDRVHSVECLLHLELHLDPDDGLTGGRQPPEQLLGERHRIGLGHGPREQRNLPHRIARRPEVFPMQELEPLAGEKSEPEKQRHRGVGGVIGKPAGGVNERLLENVGGIDSPS